MKGVQKVGVDVTNKMVSVEFDPEMVTGQNILRAFEDQAIMQQNNKRASGKQTLKTT